MAKKSQKKTITQEELRKLMKEKSNKKQITSVYAKYNSIDQLMCTLCGVVVKNENLWNAHTLSKTHKENLSKPNQPSPLPAPQKRTAQDVVSPLENKKLKISEKSGSLASLNVSKTCASSTSSDGAFNVAADGFNETEIETTAEKHDDEIKNAASLEVAGILPEGFFDDPKLDAKVRNIPFKDKLDVEMESFQKAIKEEVTISEAIIDEEDDVRVEQREIDEIDEQFNLWAKVVSLAHSKKAVKQVEMKKESDSDDEEDDVPVDNIFDWRNKAAWKKK